ncbi:hypothetical protein [Paenibacillus sp. NPDC058174]|uniref:hypothetical protein n=1 Tax=Paenibacillus sp. NPDC058174 TaxID=3346366 RepID=UPI0036DE90F6
MSLQTKSCGHNVLHLIYPLKDRKLNCNLSKDWWEQLEFSIPTKDKEKQFFFPETINYSKVDLVENIDVVKYFHPNFQNFVFAESSNEKRMKVYRLKKHNPYRKFYVINPNNSTDNTIAGLFPVEWLSTEIYQFNRSSFLVVRLSLLENIKVSFQTYINGMVNFNTVKELRAQTKDEFHTVADWMTFVNGIRINYPKFKNQSLFKIITESLNESRKEYSFFQLLKEQMDEWCNEQFIISSVINFENHTNFKRDYSLVEPMAFVHGFVTGQEHEGVEPIDYWSLNERYQIMCIDKDDGDSGGTEKFRKEFCNKHSYNRWENYGSFSTTVDYGAMTMMVTKDLIYKGEEKKSFILDTLYQHHCKHYLILILLQIYYREELFQIAGLYAEINMLEKKESQNLAKKVVSQYYDMSQYFLFDRLTNEIQGRELWDFYGDLLGTKKLYQSVRDDMRELNQRLIEFGNENQTRKVTVLTIFAGLTGMLGMNRIISESDIESGWLGFVSSTEFSDLIRWFTVMLIFCLIIYTFTMVVQLFRIPKKAFFLVAILVLGAMFYFSDHNYWREYIWSLF